MSNLNAFAQTHLNSLKSDHLPMSWIAHEGDLIQFGESTI